MSDGPSGIDRLSVFYLVADLYRISQFAQELLCGEKWILFRRLKHCTMRAVVFVVIPDNLKLVHGELTLFMKSSNSFNADAARPTGFFSRVLSEWPNIERILLSLALRTTTQSIIVSKLSAYPRRNRTKRALWEFDNIIRSLYLLDYVDSPALRRNVQQALNRGESYHQLHRAIAYAHGGRSRVSSQHDQDV